MSRNLSKNIRIYSGRLQSFALLHVEWANEVSCCSLKSSYGC